MIQLGTKLRQLREEHRLSQEEVATFLGITQSAYNKKESNQSEIKANEVFKIAELYKIAIQSLFPESSWVQFQENRDRSVGNKFIVSSSEKEIKFLTNENSLLKETNDLLKARIADLEKSKS
jgi:transcriptional regulator with XRE-family HTH domain